MGLKITLYSLLIVGLLCPVASTNTGDTNELNDLVQDTHKIKWKAFKLTNNVAVNMIWVSPGSFNMGSPETELERNALREKLHEVTISSGYWLAETELTQAQWIAVMGNNPSYTKNNSHPVNQVSYDDIQEFIAKINTGKNTFRLPTEAEWEYACRAGSEKAYEGNRDEMVWHRQNSDRKSQPVRLKKPNKWGFYDMQGNILEWCSDWFKEDCGSNTTDPKGPETGVKKVQRGGQFTGRVRHTRAADRQSALPEQRDFYVGFRLALND